MGSFAQTLRPGASKAFDPPEPAVKAAPKAPAPRPPAQAQGAEGKANPAHDLDYARPWAEEVNGVPTGSKARADDDDAVISTEVSEKKTTIGGGAVERSNTTTVSEGQKKEIHEDKVKGGYSKGTVDLSHTESDERKYSDNVSKKDTSSTGVDVSASGGHVKMGSQTETHVGERKNTTGADVKVGIKDGNLDAERKTSHKTETKGGAHEHSSTMGIEDGKLAMGSGKTDETKRKVIEKGDDGKDHEVEKTSSRGSETKVKLGPDGAGVEHAMTSKNEKGTARSTTVGVEFDKDGNFSATAGHTVTDANGNSLKVSAKAGVTVVASEPKEVGGRWVVTYKRSETIGGSAGGSAKGMGASAGASHSDFESGTRAFKSKDEAVDFREHAAERIKDNADPRSLKGALSMEIGESRGNGSEVEGNLGASISFEGAGLGGDAHKKETDQTDVRRVSVNLFEVTVMNATDEGKDLTASGGPLSNKKGESSQTHHAVTVRFDVATPEGAKAFEKYCQDKVVPTVGGKLVSTEDGKGHEVHDEMSIPLLGSTKYGGKTWENDIKDESGHHEEYGGDNTHDINPTKLARWTGDKEVHSKTEILSRQEDDKLAGYTVSGSVSGESGNYNRGKMKHLFGGPDENWDEDKVKPSGEWSMSADIDKKTVQDLAKYSSRFKGKNMDDQMRALSQWIADDGADAVQSLEHWSDKKLSWDVELKGDKNFPGRGGREVIEAKVQKYGTLLQLGGGAGAPVLVGQLQQEMSDLKVRRDAVADPTKYTDLPDGLRAQELAKIDAEIGSFEMLRHRAAIEAMKNNPGENVGALLERKTDDKAFANMTPQQKELAKLRDEIAMTDIQILDYEKRTTEAKAAILEAVHYIDWNKHAKNPEYNKRREAGWSAGTKGVDAHDKTYIKLDDTRMAFLAACDKPEAAVPLAKALLGQLQGQLTMISTASAQLEQASVAQANINKSGPIGKHAKYWDEVVMNMDPEDFTSEEAVPEEEEELPQKRTSMTLPGRR